MDPLVPTEPAASSADQQGAVRDEVAGSASDRDDTSVGADSASTTQPLIIEYGCAPESVGTMLRVEAGDAHVEGIVREPHVSKAIPLPHLVGTEHDRYINKTWKPLNDQGFYAVDSNAVGGTVIAVGPEGRIGVLPVLELELDW